ncbi:larval cuticle protein 65Ag1-like [Anopheles ziemanni]|uniref:larval cuticle protein 65Ag1-like n=1 Tax=Anopheles coustani TaxID=139045 RepID=UPI00265991E6|nr:larval cuticle protein 65Ag1-like [Anopheles coustani]XP_058166936.1 larval cuticle protein 65Ag1-like [Anopheles ziemanni]
MKTVIVFALFSLIAIVAAAPNNANILRYDNVQDESSYKFGFESDDQITRDEEGQLKTEEEGLSVRGSYKYVADDGVTYEVQYIADSQGFQPVGDHIPQEYVPNVPSL